MARKEIIYAVSKSTNAVVRASCSYLAALEFAATQPDGAIYLCTSEFQSLKKGDPMSNIVDFL